MSFIGDIENGLGSAASFVGQGLVSAGSAAVGAIGSAAGAIGSELAGIGTDITGALGAVGDFLGVGDPGVQQRLAAARNSVNTGGLDPIQGYDVGVWVEDIGRGHQQVLLGQFTSILVTVKNASEPYMPVGSRQPVYFDGEMQIAFTLEKGLLDALVFQETFGFRALDFNNRYYRSPRFKITFMMDPVDWWALDQPTRTMDGVHKRYPSGRIVLDLCKIDSWHLGSRAGKDVVATQWSGLAQQIYAIPHTLESLAVLRPTVPLDQAYDTSDGLPRAPGSIYTFKYDRPAQAATTDVLPAQRSYELNPGVSQATILQGERAALLAIPGWQGVPGLSNVIQAALDSIDAQLSAMGAPGGSDNFPGTRSTSTPAPTSSAFNSLEIAALSASKTALLQSLATDPNLSGDRQATLQQTVDALDRRIFALTEGSPRSFASGDPGAGTSSRQRELQQQAVGIRAKLADPSLWGPNDTDASLRSALEQTDLALARNDQQNKSYQASLPANITNPIDGTFAQTDPKSKNDGLSGQSGINVLRAERQGYLEMLASANTPVEKANAQLLLNRVNTQLSGYEEPKSHNDHFVPSDGVFGLGGHSTRESHNDGYVAPLVNNDPKSTPLRFIPAVAPTMPTPLAPASHQASAAEIATELAKKNAIRVAQGLAPLVPAGPNPPDPKSTPLAFVPAVAPTMPTPLAPASHQASAAETAAELARKNTLRAAAGLPPLVPPGPNVPDPKSTAT